MNHCFLFAPACLACLLAACAGAAPHASSPAASPAAVAPGAQEPTAPVGASEDDAGVPLGPSDPTWGSRTAPVTIVEFADFQCPFCARAEPTLAQIRKTYGPEKVRIVWKHSPLDFHANARPAAEAGAGVRALAGDDAFWRFLDLVFHHPDDLGEDAYVAWAAQAGVHGPERLRAGLRSHAWAAKVDADLAEARELGVTGTPTFYVNGIVVVGARGFDAFQTIIDAQAISAQAKVTSGTAPDRVYAVLSRENRAAQPPDRDDDEEPEDTKTVFKVPVGASPVRGPAGALVTIVEFADYECPFCVRVEATLRDLRSAYGDKLRLVFKHEPLPFHPRAEPAAEAALEVRTEKGDAAFWAVHDAMLDDPHDLGDDALVALAVKAGARADKVQAAIAKHSHAAEIAVDSDTADDFQANGTPHFFINGRRLVGAQPKARFAEIIDDEIKKAQGLLDAGTKPEALYDALTKDGHPAPQPEQIAVDALPSTDPVRGSANARVTVHEFADFECPFCARAEATMKQIAKSYGDRVRFAWHDLPLPFHEHALPAARAAREARKQRGDGVFWKLHDTLLADRSKLARSDLDDDARALGLDMTRWAAALDGDGHGPEIDLDGAAARALGFTGTPSFVIVGAGAKHGYAVVGAQDYSKFRKLIERVLGEPAR
jgi:protein-disulfide isomerase